MNDQEYLKQISDEVRSEKKSVTGFMSSTAFKVGVGGLVAFIVLAIFGTILSSGKVDLKTRCAALRLRLTNTAEVISDYQNNIKSSALRSNSASLRAVLSDTSNKLLGYLEEKYSLKDGRESKDLKEEAKLNKENLEASLFEAKINGILDRMFAHEMAYEVSLLITEETSIYNAGDSALKSIMETSLTSLKSLHEIFDNYSETK